VDDDDDNINMRLENYDFTALTSMTEKNI